MGLNSAPEKNLFPYRSAQWIKDNMSKGRIDGRDESGEKNPGAFEPVAANDGECKQHGSDAEQQPPE